MFVYELSGYGFESSCSHLKFKISVEKDFVNMMNFSTCRLHIVHGALHTTMTESSLNVLNFLCAIWKIFDESPAKREVYVTETCRNIFPVHSGRCRSSWFINGDLPFCYTGCKVLVNTSDNLLECHTDHQIVKCGILFLQLSCFCATSISSFSD